MNRKRAATFLLGASLSCACFAGDPAQDWQQVTALDAGPAVQPKDANEARTVTFAQIEAQEKALRAFLAQHPADQHAFEGRLRLARLLRTRADFQSSDKLRREAVKMLDDLERSATSPEQHAEIDFTRITTLMRSMRGADPRQRDELLTAVRRFEAAHPADRRLGALLAETSTIFDDQLETKAALLTAALRVATDEEVKDRVTDDLKRLSLLGSEIPLHFTDADGKTIDLAGYRGKVVALLYFAAWSPSSLIALKNLHEAAAAFPKEKLQVVCVSLDGKVETARETLRQNKVTWPLVFDGKGWESPFVRPFGINSLPTLWLIDGAGRLRSLNALEQTATRIQQLLAAP